MLRRLGGTDTRRQGPLAEHHGKHRHAGLFGYTAAVMMAPAVATLTQKLAGIFTTCSQRSSISGDRQPRSGPRT